MLFSFCDSYAIITVITEKRLCLREKPSRGKRGNGDSDMLERDDDLKSEIIYGRNPVMEALEAGRELETLYVGAQPTGSALKIISMAKARGIPVKETRTERLRELSGSESHQGVVAVAAAFRYSKLGEVFALAKSKDEPPFVVICDGIEDPHNLGAIIRTAEACGAHGVIIPKRRSVGLTPAVCKAAAGAVEHIPVVRVANLAQTMETLKNEGLWLYAADVGGQDWDTADYSGGAGIVVGSEGRGVGRLVRESCDVVVSLPMHGKVNSLNASVAAGIIMYEAARQRKLKNRDR